MNSNVLAITGYMGSGSSAVIDLLEEYETIFSAPQIGRTYEHIPFYFRGGLFDLYNSLKYGCSPINSDANINRFIASMKLLNDNKFTWCGNYKSLTGNRFEDINKTFINSISTPFKAKNVNHYTGTRYSLFRLIGQIGAKILLKRKIYYPGVAVTMDTNKVYFGLPTLDELNKAAREYTSSYFSIFTGDKQGTFLFDHTVLPQQIDHFSDCFDDNVKFIVVIRDPRDVFLLNKYVWYTPPIGHGDPYFPTDPYEFAELWKRMIVLSYSSSQCLLVRFEDLVYKYEETINRIESFIGISSERHSKQKCIFNPEDSIENTQVFNANDVWKKEVDCFETLLNNYLYEFPYDRKPIRDKMFDK